MRKFVGQSEPYHDYTRIKRTTLRFFSFRRGLPLLALLFLSGCGDDSAPKASTNSDSPEITATAFFDAILVKNDLELAKKFSDSSIDRVLDGYSSGKQLARTLWNMSFDTVEINAEDNSRNVREFYGEDASVTLIFNGMKDAEAKITFRLIKLKRINGKWQVVEIKSDPFARTEL
jgi:hypothetical protein